MQQDSPNSSNKITAALKKFFSAIGAWFKKLTSTKWGVVGLSGGALVLIAGAALLIFLVPGNSSANEPEPPEPGPSFTIDDSVYGDTVLAQTSDAGQSYVEDTLLIGDSNTLRYYMFGVLDIENVIGVEGMSIAQVKDLDCVYFVGKTNPVSIPAALELIQPQRIILNFGTNNLVDDTPENFKKTYGEILDILEEAYPYATIIIQSIHPVGPNTGNSRLNRENVIAFNEVLLELAKERDLKFLNTFEMLVDSDGYIKDEYIISDGVHLTQEALDACLQYMRTHSHITEDTRPKPLEDCPARRPAPYVPKEEEEEPTSGFDPGLVLSYSRDMLSANGLTILSAIDGYERVDFYSYAVGVDVEAGTEQNVAITLVSQVYLTGTHAVVSYSGSAESGYTFTVTLYKAAETQPPTTDPGTTDPGTTDPGTTDPGTTDPGTTDPGTTDPGTTDPGTTDPGVTGTSGILEDPKPGEGGT